MSKLIALTLEDGGDSTTVKKPPMRKDYPDNPSWQKDMKIYNDEWIKRKGELLQQSQKAHKQLNKNVDKYCQPKGVQGCARDAQGNPLKKEADGGEKKKVNTLEGDLISKIIMNRNQDKDFVQRAFALGENPNNLMFNTFDPEQFGSKMSHKMGWGEDDSGQAYMFPTIYNPNNESIKVPNQYADYISSKGYKRATEMEKYPNGGVTEVDRNVYNNIGAGKKTMNPNEYQQYLADTGRTPVKVFSPLDTTLQAPTNTSTVTKTQAPLLFTPPIQQITPPQANYGWNTPQSNLYGIQAGNQETIEPGILGSSGAAIPFQEGGKFVDANFWDKERQDSVPGKTWIPDVKDMPKVKEEQQLRLDTPWMSAKEAREVGISADDGYEYYSRNVDGRIENFSRRIRPKEQPLYLPNLQPQQIQNTPSITPSFTASNTTSLPKPQEPFRRQYKEENGKYFMQFMDTKSNQKSWKPISKETYRLGMENQDEDLGFRQKYQQGGNTPIQLPPPQLIPNNPPNKTTLQKIEDIFIDNFDYGAERKANKLIDEKLPPKYLQSSFEDDEVDAMRHTGTAMYLANTGKEDGAVSSFVRANLLGLGHEIVNFDKKSSWMDISNNFKGSIIGANPFLTIEQKEQKLLNMLEENKLNVIESTQPEIFQSKQWKAKNPTNRGSSNINRAHRNIPQENGGLIRLEL